MKVKAITTNNPLFLKLAYKLDDRIELVDSEIYIKPHEKYLKYQDRWLVFRMGSDNKPRLQGKYEDVFSAIHKARI